MRTRVASAATSPVLSVSLSAVWSDWTVVLSEFGAGEDRPIIWIDTGIPVCEPAPTDLFGCLADRGYQFIPAVVRDGRGHGRLLRLGFAWVTP